MEKFHISTSIRGKVLVKKANKPRVQLVGFHGYAEDAEIMFKRLESLSIPEASLISVQALHPFYKKDGTVVANWMTKDDRELAIEDNINYIGNVLKELTDSVAPVICLGFSQGVAMAYRTAFYFPDKISALVNLGGDLPPELSNMQIESKLRIAIARGDSDPYYLAQQFETDCKNLISNGFEISKLSFSGAHDWNDEFNKLCTEFIESQI